MGDIGERVQVIGEIVDQADGSRLLAGRRAKRIGTCLKRIDGGTLRAQALLVFGADVIGALGVRVGGLPADGVEALQNRSGNQADSRHDAG